ncbi:hypothetical protein QSH57_008065 [Fusarium oxysporum f. sp. vasinfectum]|nr:hypothetical protein QSH57_008065 [Fusarium oxysporum f. sp. vasinfectum]
MSSVPQIMLPNRWYGMSAEGQTPLAKPFQTAPGEVIIRTKTRKIQKRWLHLGVFPRDWYEIAPSRSIQHVQSILKMIKSLASEIGKSKRLT